MTEAANNQPTGSPIMILLVKVFVVSLSRYPTPENIARYGAIFKLINNTLANKLFINIKLTGWCK